MRMPRFLTPALLAFTFLPIFCVSGMYAFADPSSIEPVQSVAFSPDGRFLAAAGDTTAITVYDLPRNKIEAVLTDHWASVRCVAFSPDGKALISRAADGTVKVWETSGWSLLRSISAATDRAAVAAVAPDNTTMAVDGPGGDVALWDVMRGKQRTSLKGSGYVTGLAFSPDGRRLAGTASDGTARVWDITSAAVRSTLTVDTEWARAVLWSRDGSKLITGGDDGKIKIWNPDTGAREATLVGHTKPITSLSAADDGQSLVSASEDGTVRQWDLRSDKAVKILFTQAMPVWSATVAAEGALLAAGSDDGSVLLRSLPTLQSVSLPVLDADDPRVQAARRVRDAARLTSAGQHDQRIALDREANALDPSDFAAKIDLAAALYDDWQFDRSVAGLEANLAAETNLARRDEIEATLAYAEYDWAKNLEDHTQYALAIPHFQASYTHYQPSDPRTAAQRLGDIAACYDSLYDDEDAVKYGQQELAEIPAGADAIDRANIDRAIADYETALNHYGIALKYMKAALQIAQARKDVQSQGVFLNQLGNICLRLGQYSRAQRCYLVSLPMFEQNNDRQNLRTTTGNVALTWCYLGDYRRALDFCRKANSVQTGDDLSYDHYSWLEARAYLGLHQFSLARAALEDYLKTAREQNNRSDEADALYRFGVFELQQKNYARCASDFEQAAIAARAIRQPREEADSLAGLMEAAQGSRDRNLAVFFGKKAVNLYQQIRRQNTTLDSASQRDLVNLRSGTYRKLAEILISLGRIPEAQQVLDLLKDQEFDQFVRRASLTQPSADSTATQTFPEQDAGTKYDAKADALALCGRTCDELSTAKQLLVRANRASEWTDEQERQLEYAQDAVTVSKQQFADFITGLRTEFDQSKPVAGEKISAIQDAKAIGKGLTALEATSPGAVIIYTLVTDTKCHTVLITPKVSVAKSVDIPAATLNREITDFRIALEHPDVDPRPIGRRLYRVLVGPLQHELNLYHAGTLLWSLDGALRYIPVSALWDGTHYLAERYRNVVFVPAFYGSMTDLPAARWNVLGLGVSHAFPHFPLLSSVPDELAGIVRSSTRSDAGVLPGKVLLNGDFTEKTLTDALGANAGGTQTYPVVHIATHFVLDPANGDNSALLLGDGNLLSLAKIDTMADDFQNVDLLTLSACETAVPTPSATGSEIEGFSRMAMRDGAKAVIATLWSVDDGSTCLFMKRFYEAKQMGGLSKAAALQAAEFSLLHGTALRLPGQRARNIERVPAAWDKADDMPVFTADPKAPYAHPYFWAPFILTGNSL